MKLFKNRQQKLLKYINHFNPTRTWDGPTIDGLSATIGKAIAKEPNRFSEELYRFNNISNTYFNNILYGFANAWKLNKSFNWKNVLNFIKDYITSDNFYSKQINSLDEGKSGSPEWALESISNLLVEGMKSDENSIDLIILPQVKDILKALVTNLKQTENLKEETDFLTHSLNSTAGKVLLVLLEYSLFRARNLKEANLLVKWESDVIELFESTFKKKIIDGYIMMGMYFQQFYFLDKEWLVKKVKENYTLEEPEWSAFVSGLICSNPPFNNETYLLLYPFYEKAINNNREFNRFGHTGMMKHLVAFYFWGFEDLKSGGLFKLFIDTVKPQTNYNLINFVWTQEGFLKSLSFDEPDKFEEAIFNFWNYLAEKYNSTSIEEEQKALAALSHLLVFVPELNEKYTQIVLKSTVFPDGQFHFHFLFEALIKLKEKGNPKLTAMHIGQILDSLPFSTGLFTVDNQVLSELVVFLYENGQNKIGEAFCNKLARQGKHFEYLIEIHNRYKDNL